MNYRTISKLLQDDLDTLLKWNKTWKMSFNLSKCIHLKISNKHFSMPPSYNLDEHAYHTAITCNFSCNLQPT